MEKIDLIIEMVRRIKEEGPTMAMGNGQIAGSVEAGDDPPVRKKKKNKYIYVKGARKLWQQK
jgi:hypothetical protein